ncbi:MAG: TonB-dependent receptor [Balneolaceae bacterium]
MEYLNFFKQIRVFPLLFIALSLTMIGRAQPNPSQNTGKIAGQVVDAKTGETVIGANVAITGTTKGAATDLDGKFSIRGLKPGIYSITVSYISYAKKKITGIEVNPGRAAMVNISLEPKTVGLDEVTVTAQANSSSEAGLLSIQRKSVPMQDGIASEQISKIGDSNVGEAMKRVTGVTVENGKDIYVRGLGNRYSNIQLNGAQMPSTDPNKKEVPTDLLGTGLVNDIMVQKTYTVDQMAEFSGGSVKIKTKEFPYDRNFTVSYSSSYNTVSTLGSTLSSVGSSTDFIGYDNGMRSLPSVLKNQRIGTDNAATFENALSNNWNLNRNRHALPSQNISLSYANQLNQDKMPIGVVGNFSYKYNRKEEPNKIERFMQGYNSDQSPDKQNFLTNYTKNSGVEVADVSGMVNVFVKPSPVTKFGIKNLYSNSLNNTATIVQGQYQNGVTRQTVSDFDRRSIISSTLEGDTYFENFLSSKLFGHLSYNRAVHDRPDRRTTRYNKVRNSGPQQYRFQQFGDNNGHFFSTQKDNNYSGEIKYEMKPFNFLNVAVGGNAMIKDRHFKARRISYRDQTSPFLPNDLVFKSPDVILRAQNIEGVGPDSTGYLELTEKTQFNQDFYNGHQNIYAGYINMDWKPIDRLTIGLGLRLEQSNQKVEVPDSLNGAYHQVSKVDSTDLLPAVNVTYALNSRTNIRAAYSQTLARPSFREISNFSFADYQGGRRVYGNPDLTQTNITNYDLRFETYPQGGQLFSVGLFYKHFKQPIELFYRIVDANEVFYQNAPEANLYGVEVEGRKNITDRLKLIANGTYIYSQTRMDSSSVSRVAHLERPMIGQSPYVVNLSAFYTVPDWHMNFSLSFNTYGKRIVTVGKKQQQFDEYEQPFQKLGAKIDYTMGRYYLSLEVDNLLNDVHEYKMGPVTTYKYKPGMIFNLGLTMRL